MTYLADQFGGGLDPLQNFDLRSIPIEVRKGRYAARIKGHDAAGRPIIEQDSVGDVRNAMMWEPTSRAIAAWSHAMPVVGGSPVNASGGNFSDPDLVAKEGGAGGNAAPGAGGAGPKAGDGLKWKKIGGMYYYYDKKNGTWRSGEYTVKPPPFGLNAPGGGALITWPEGRQRDPGFGLNAPGGVFIGYPKPGSGGQRRSGAVGPVGPAGAQGQGGAVGNAGPAGAVRPGARSITGEPGPSFQASPIRGEYGEDGTIAPKSIGLPQGFPSLAGGSVGLVVGGTEHTYEAPVYLHGDPRLVAVNEGPDPTASSVVLDTDDRGRLNPNLAAPLHSAWRVIEPIFSRTATGARGTLAWQLARGERDGVAGFGAIVDTSVRGGSKPAAVTTGASQQGAGGSSGGTVGVQTGTGYKAGEAYTFIKGGASMGSPANPGIVYNPKSAGAAAPAAAGATKDDTPALCVGLTSARVGGPLEVGHGKADKHRIGDSGSRAVNVAHVPVGALFFRDAVQDAPLDFEPGFMPKVAEFPMRAAVHLQYHAASTHSIPGKSGIPGRWKWWAEVPYTEEGGGRVPVPTPTDPPVKEPKDPVPVDDPPVREPRDPTVTPKPDRPTTGKPKQGTPITGRDPTDPNPLGEPPASASGAGAAVGGRRKELLRDYDGTFETPGDGAIGSIPTASTYPSFAKPRSPGGKTDKTVVHPGVEAFTAQTWKPQGTGAATIDLRAGGRVSVDEIAKQSRERPTTLRAEAYGGQTGGVFVRTQTRGASRFVGGTGPGGLVYLPPEQDILDVDRASFVPTSSTSYVGAVPGVYFATGYPLLSTGGWKTGYRWGGDSSGNLVFSAMSSAGAATTAITLDASGHTTLGKRLKFSSVLTPAQVTSNQNDYNPTGLSAAAIVRISSDAARSITGLTTGSDDPMLILTNIGAFTITLKNEDVASTAANRFLFGSDLALAADESVWLTYDNTSLRWRLVSRSAGSLTAHVAEGDPHAQYQLESEKDSPSGYAGLDGSGRVVKGVKATDDLIVDDTAKGLVLKDNAGTPHYWRISVSTAGVLSAADLGTTAP